MFIKDIYTKSLPTKIGQLPNEFVHIDSQFVDLKSSNGEKPPSIFITSHEPNHGNNILDDMFGRPAPPLSVQTQPNRSLGPYGNNNGLPPSPSPSMLVSDDELDNSMYSPNSPHTPRHGHSNSYSSTSSVSFMNNNPLDPLSHR